MKVKNIKLSVLVLAGLVILSYAFLSLAEEKSSASQNIFLDSDQDGLSDEEERTYGTDPQNRDTDGDSYSDGVEITSGYDPLKQAPNDRILPNEPENTEIATGVTGNLTKEVAQKITDLTASGDGETKEVSLEEIDNLVQDSLKNTVTEEDMPEVNEDEIKIKKQNYSKLSKQEKDEKKREDFIQYASTIYYIFASNSPEPIDSKTNLVSVFRKMSTNVILAVTSRNSSSLDNLQISGEKILEQLKEVEVPEDMIETHVKAMRFALYAMKIKDNVNPTPNDPLMDIKKLTEIQGFLENSASFFAETAFKLDEEGFNYADDFEKSVLNLGLEIPTESTTSDQDNADLSDEETADSASSNSTNED